MPRAMWKGSVSFGLVMVPVVMYPAEAPGASLDFDLIDSRSGDRVRYRRVNERSGKEVPWGSISKGYKMDDHYVVLSDADFKKAASGVVRGIEIMEFVPAESISPLYVQKPYYLGPGKGGEKVYTLLREVLKKSGQVGIARAVIHTREHLAALTVTDDVLTLLILRFGDELRAPGEIEVPHLKVNARELKMASELVKSMEAEWDPGRYHDAYTDALRKYIEQKEKSGAKGARVAVKEEEEGEAPASYNIMELLRKSVGSQQSKPSPRAASRSRSTRSKRKAG